MHTRIHWISHELVPAQRLGTMARPRGNDWLEDEIVALKRQGVGCLVSLLEYQEADELGLREEGKWCREMGLEFVNHPIPDVQVPANPDAFGALAKQLAVQVQAGRAVVTHSRMGIGRSSMLAAAILIGLGVSAEEIFPTISAARGRSVPDTQAQVDWILKHQDRFRD